MRRFLILTALLVAPVAARADDFNINISVNGLNTAATLTGTSNGDGSYTVTSVSSGLVSPTVVQNDILFGADNLFYPTAARLFDVAGLTVTGLFGTANLFSTVSGYEIQGYDATNTYFDLFPVSVALAPTTVTPEPSGLVLGFTGLIAGAGVCFRKRFTGLVPQTSLR